MTLCGTFIMNVIPNAVKNINTHNYITFVWANVAGNDRNDVRQKVFSPKECSTYF